MKYFAKLDSDNIITNISIANDDWSADGWIEVTEENPAYIGGDYFEGHIYPENSYLSWTRNGTGLWNPPVPRPTDGKLYKWNESTLSWDELNG
jgi:hypothetical protein